MQEQPRILPPQKLLQHILRMPPTPLDIHRFQDRNDILQQELRVLGSPGGVRCFARFVVVRGGVQKAKDLQFATDPLPRFGDEVGVVGEHRGGEVVEAGEAV